MTDTQKNQQLARLVDDLNDVDANFNALKLKAEQLAEGMIELSHQDRVFTILGALLEMQRVSANEVLEKIERAIAIVKAAE